jgi:hypothetical protein
LGGNQVQPEVKSDEPITLDATINITDITGDEKLQNIPLA